MLNDKTSQSQNECEDSAVVISYEELSKKYPIHNVSPYGEVIVVPGDKFDPDWESILEDCSCFDSKFEGNPVTLVHKDKVERVVHNKPETREVSETERHLVPWTKEEIERFIKLWNEDPNYEKILKSFPNRTEIALIKKATELKKRGIIENAYVVKDKIKKKEPLKSISEVRKPHPMGNPIFQSNEYVWSEKEEKLLIELWNAKTKTVSQIQKELAKFRPSEKVRSVSAIRGEVRRLQVRGLIKPKFEWKRNRGTMEKIRIQEEMSKEKVVDLQTPESPVFKHEAQKSDVFKNSEVHIPEEVTRMKTQQQIETRLRAENAACKADKTLLKNDYVCGYMQALEWVLDLVKN